MTGIETEPTTDYLFVHFTGFERTPDDEQLYFALSHDGRTWHDLRAHGDPVLRSDQFDRGVRDPYIIREPHGTGFTIIATDLSIYHRNGWSSTRAHGSTRLVVWHSDDLIDWGEPWYPDVASAIPGAGCAWAPEAIWDEANEWYAVYFAVGADMNTAQLQPDEPDGSMNVYMTTTRDFHEFTTPVKWIDYTGYALDTTVIKANGHYYRASSTEGGIPLEVCDDLYATSIGHDTTGRADRWKGIATVASLFPEGNWFGKLEGPELFLRNRSDWRTVDGEPAPTWGLMCDQFREGKGYIMFSTTDLDDATGSAWQVDDIDFGTLVKRHGSILPITATEAERLRTRIAR